VGTRPLRRIRPETHHWGAYRYVASLGPYLYFIADDGRHGSELWRTDGTAKGTRLVKDLRRGRKGSSDWSGAARAVGATLYFTADDGRHGWELWRTNGTAAGTSLVLDIRPGRRSARPVPLAVAGNLLFLTADDGRHGRELWVTDGTSEGTALLTDSAPGPDGIGDYTWPPLRGEDEALYFAADMGDGHAGLWRTDGTPSGTSLLHVAEAGELRLVTVVGDIVYFGAEGGIDGWELWRTDGTAAGTTSLVVMGPGVPGEGQFASIDEQLYFVTYEDGSDGDPRARDLWRTDGTLEGTVLVKTFQPRGERYPGLGPADLTVAGGTLFLIDDDQASDWGLWRSDGTPEGTFQLREFRSGGVGDARSDGFAVLDGSIYLTIDDGYGSWGLWRSDGTVEGTTLVRGFAPWPEAGRPNSLWVLDGALYFSAGSRAAQDSGSFDSVPGWHLWRSDGTSEGTTLVKAIRRGFAVVDESVFPLGDGLYFAVSNCAASQLWHTDGTPEGTVRLLPRPRA